MPIKVNDKVVSINGTQYQPGTVGYVSIPFTPHEAQSKIINSPKRFKLVCAGRRFGKSLCAAFCSVMAGLSNTVPGGYSVVYASPFYRQTKDIAFSMFRDLVPKECLSPKKGINESELKFYLRNGSTISLVGTDNEHSLRGRRVDFLVLDEASSMKRNVWYEIFRPMLVDNPKSKVIFISTPRGYNWLHELWNRVGDDPAWERFHFKTVDNTAVPGIAHEVELAKKDAISEYDKVLFKQEYEAEFQIMAGRMRFDMESLNKLAELSTDPIGSEGGLRIYQQPESGSNYVLGVDTAEGLVTGDNSSVVVLNVKTFKVDAVYTGKDAPDILSFLVQGWAEKYNHGLVVVEDNNHGLALLNELKKNYHNLYHRKSFDEHSNLWSKKLGFRTSVRTKPLLVANVDKCLRDGLDIKDRMMIDELRTYVIDDDGKTAAQEGSHDDTVMALGCAVQGFLETSKGGVQKAPTPVPRWSVAASMTRRQALVDALNEDFFQ